MPITIGIIDDHRLFREGIELMLQSSDVAVVMQASNGQDFRYRLEEGKGSLPDIMFIDTDMPVMNGFETTLWLRKHHPSVKLMAMPIDARDNAILIRMLKAGCCGFLYKDFEPRDWLKAIRQVLTKGYFNAEANDMMSFWENFPKLDKSKSPLSEDKQRFLELACSDMRYEQIIEEMNLTRREANRYIDTLFRKFHVTGRNGLVFEALRKGFIQLSEP